MKRGVDPEEMLAALRTARRGDAAFDAERFVNRFPARKHDHYLIPGGTVHCSGARVIDWTRDTDEILRRHCNRFEPIAEGEGWREERTGLHEAEFIETRRHWFTGITPHTMQGGVEVLNLVEGDAAVIESPAGTFEPFTVHYAETFIIPASIGSYTIRPLVPGTFCGTVKAYVRH